MQVVPFLFSICIISAVVLPSRHKRVPTEYAESLLHPLLWLYFWQKRSRYRLPLDARHEFEKVCCCRIALLKLAKGHHPCRGYCIRRTPVACVVAKLFAHQT